ncbi:hypothetical protein KHA94_13580 [Bacillus sp. FJAT-49705]|uniref:Phage protein n=1 Tax=Cytobacillus citreus TaxID=2833586 RepID=A0ABS5NTR4_9BACI|nr:hypothetical protein [Cytobacillus citreus]MBS4191214.1 hypothetical protein [Cytobacillus citreus]
MRIAQIDNNVIFYLEVEPEYINAQEGKGKNDAISFVMGHRNEEGHEIDAVVSVSIEDARAFAEAILKVCVEVEGERQEEEQE